MLCYCFNLTFEMFHCRGWKMDSLSQQVFETRVQFNVIFTQVPEQLIGPQHLGDSHQLQKTSHSLSLSKMSKCVIVCGFLYLGFTVATTDRINAKHKFTI